MPHLQSHGSRDKFPAVPKAGGGLGGEHVRQCRDKEHHPTGHTVNHFETPRRMVLDSVNLHRLEKFFPVYSYYNFHFASISLCNPLVQKGWHRLEMINALGVISTPGNMQRIARRR